MADREDERNESRAGNVQPSITRRRLLAGTGQLALLAAWLPTGCAPVANRPWSDGTFWDDGLGWAD